MKKIFYLLMFASLICTSCVNSTLDLYPLAQPTAETWFSDETQIQFSLNDQYRPDWWKADEGICWAAQNTYTDDFYQRQTIPETKAGTITSQWGWSTNLWTNSYKSIARSNSILQALNSEKIKALIPSATLNKYIGEARFFRAAMYSKLISHFGDVVYSDQVISLDSAFSLGRIDKNTVLKKIYQDFDAAAAVLPQSYAASAAKRVTKGAALALKARAALFMGDFATAAAASKATMDLGEYSLQSDYTTLFLQSNKNAKEVIFGLPTSKANGMGNFNNPSNNISRNAGGFAGQGPTWDLFNSYLCTDGLPIDKSPLYNPRNPWKNRDPRCSATIVEFGTDYLGYIYDPNPTALKSLKTSNNTLITNNDNRAVNQFASFNGLVWKKSIDLTWVPVSTAEPDQIIIRYGDVLLMYAEAKTEINQIDQSVLDAVNSVRARAYKVPVTSTNLYPAITTKIQADLRRAIRIERRMEMAGEDSRYMDIVRWKLATKVLTRPIYGMLDPADCITKVVNRGLWFFPGIPTIDADGVSDYTTMYNAGLIKLLNTTSWNDRQYLWPIPTAEVQTNPNIKQNPGY